MKTLAILFLSGMIVVAGIWGYIAGSLHMGILPTLVAGLLIGAAYAHLAIRKLFH